MRQEAFSSLFEVNMGIAKGERILVFSDRIRPDESPSPTDLDRRTRLLATALDIAEFADRTYGNASFIEFPATAASGAEPPESLWRAAFGDEFAGRLQQEGIFRRILDKQTIDGDLDRAREIAAELADRAARVVIALSNNSTSHTHFRGLMNAAGTRFASLPHFEPEMFSTSMLVDWRELAARTARLAEKVNGGIALELTTAAGTSLRMSIQGRTAQPDDGILTAPGSFGNLPAGEVFLAPLEGTTEGEIVVEYAPTRKLESPLTFVVKKGEVVEIRGSDPYRDKLEKKFAESAKNRNIAELGIGTNDRATRPDNVLEAEKILGTVHVALGDNHGFGGLVTTPFHEDFVLYLPTLVSLREDGSREVLLEKGRLLI